MKKLLFFTLILISNTIVRAQALDNFFTKSDVFFKTYVIANKVDYQSLKINPKPLDELLTIASTIDLNNSDANNFKAFWVNIYNLIVIKSIVTKYPAVKSAIDVNGFFDRNTYAIAKQNITLKQIENNMLKSTFKDPLLNFVLVCAANGCPPLVNEAYLPFTLEEQMLKRAKFSLNNPNFIRVNNATKTVEVSQIFEWYKEDFIDKEKKILDFINKYRDLKIDDSYSVAYYKYDWSLNKLN